MKFSTLFLAIIMPISFNPCEAANLTSIKWKHAVNSMQLLTEALKSKYTIC